MKQARNIVLLFLLISLNALHAQDLQKDTSLVVQRQKQIDQLLDLYQLDSAARLVTQNLLLLEDVLKRPIAQEDEALHNALFRMKGFALVQKGESEPDVSVVEPFEQAVAIFKGIGNKRGEAHAYVRRADRAEDMGAYLGSIQFLRQAIMLLREVGDDLEVARVSNTAGVYYRIMGDASTALEYHLEALPVIEATGKHEDIGWCYILLGAVHRATREPEKAVQYFDKAREEFLLTTDSVLLAISYNDLGSGYQIAGQYDTALFWHHRAANLRKRLGSLDGYGHSQQYIGEIHQTRKEYEVSIEHFKRAIDSYGNVPMPGSMARCYGRIANIYYETGRKDTALQVMESAVQLMERFQDRQFMAMLIYRWAVLLEKHGDISKAIEVNKMGLAEAIRQKDHFEQARGHKQLMANYQAKGNHQLAYQHHRDMMAAHDSSDRRTQNSQVLQLMLKYDVEQLNIQERAHDEAQRNELDSRVQSRTRQKYFYIASGSLLAILALGLAGRVNFSSRIKRRLEKQRKELRRAIIKAEQSEKFKERFLANMSHEVRTPMNAILGMTAILRRNQHNREQEVYLGAIAESADSLLQIINDILDFSKLDADRLDLELTSMDTVFLARKLVEELRKVNIGKGLEITFLEQEGPIPNVLGDPTRFRQVLFNLVQNAIKFTDVGFVRLQLSVIDEGLSSTTIKAVVSDSGRGIESERLDSIFEEFNKAYADGKHKYGGSGLGLALTKRLVELMGGTINVESEEGKGSTFTVVIPFETAGARTAEKGPTEPVDLSGLRILLTDDNEFNIVVAQDELEDAIPGVKVEVARNGREAFEMAQAKDFDLILMDIQMPEMNGYDATRAIRELEGELANIPVLAMTANGMESEVTRCMEAGMDGFVPKPFKREELLTAISKQLTQRS